MNKTDVMVKWDAKALYLTEVGDFAIYSNGMPTPSVAVKQMYQSSKIVNEFLRKLTINKGDEK